MGEIGHNIDGALNAFIERIADRENDKRAAASDIADIKLEAKSAGYNPKVIAKLVKEQLEDASAKARREEEEAIEELYRNALGLRG